MMYVAYVILLYGNNGEKEGGDAHIFKSNVKFLKKVHTLVRLRYAIEPHCYSNFKGGVIMLTWSNLKVVDCTMEGWRQHKKAF